MGNDLQLYKQLLSLPLFQGLSKGDLEEVVTHTRLGFETYNEGQYIGQENATSRLKPSRPITAIRLPRHCMHPNCCNPNAYGD